jgi:hypothetical protein
LIRYGPPRIAQRIANFSLEAMLHLAVNEFTEVERQRKLGVLVSLFHLVIVSMNLFHFSLALA